MKTKLSYYFSSTDKGELDLHSSRYNNLYEYYTKLGHEATITTGENWVELEVFDFVEPVTLPPRCEACGE